MLTYSLVCNAHMQCIVTKGNYRKTVVTCFQIIVDVSGENKAIIINVDVMRFGVSNRLFESKNFFEIQICL